jgi:hypothetical protein
MEEVLHVKVHKVVGLKNPQRRPADCFRNIMMAMTGKQVIETKIRAGWQGEYKQVPYMTQCLTAICPCLSGCFGDLEKKYAQNKEGVYIAYENVFTDKDGNAAINQEDIIPLKKSSGEPVNLETELLTIKVFDDRGALSEALSGDPLVGAVSFRVDQSVLSGAEQELTLQREGSSDWHGWVFVTVRKERRQRRKIELLRVSCIPGYENMAEHGIKPTMLAHWSLAIDEGGYEVDGLRFPNEGESAVFGPKGLVSCSNAATPPVEMLSNGIPLSQELIDLMTSKRSSEPGEKQNGGYTSYGKKIAEGGKDAVQGIKHNDWLPVFHSRDYNNYAWNNKEEVGSTFRTDEEIEAACKKITAKKPVYNVISNSCQIFAQDLYRYCSSGHVLQVKSDHDQLMGWSDRLQGGSKLN